jgi:hypothetical protein
MVQDRVHSTPPTNTSSVQGANPPLDARAESVDSFLHQPAIGHRQQGRRLRMARRQFGGPALWIGRRS